MKDLLFFQVLTIMQVKQEIFLFVHLGGCLICFGLVFWLYVSFYPQEGHTIFVSLRLNTLETI